MALGFLPEIMTLRRAIDSINHRYFDGQQILFQSSGEGFDQLLALVEKTVSIYNDALAEDIERLESLLTEREDGENESPLTIDLAVMTENVQVAAGAQVTYMVDMAKADALDMLGEARSALQLVERHV